MSEGGVAVPILFVHGMWEVGIGGIIVENFIFQGLVRIWIFFFVFFVRWILAFNVPFRYRHSINTRTSLPGQVQPPQGPLYLLW